MTQISARTERNQTRLERFEEWADIHGVEFQVYESEDSWKDNLYTCYMQDEEHGDRDLVCIAESRDGELSAEIYNDVGSLEVVIRASGLVSHTEIDNTGEQDQERMEVHPVSSIKTRGEVGPYDMDENDCLVLGSFDIDPARGVDHDVADIEFVIDPR